MKYEGYRYLLYRRFDYGWRNSLSEEETEALEAGKELFQAANFDHWATDAGRVERVNEFLARSVSGYSTYFFRDRPRAIIGELVRAIQSGEVVIVRAHLAALDNGLLGPFPKTPEPKEREYLSEAARRWNSPADRDENGMIILGRRVLEFVGTGASFRAVYADEVSPVSHAAVGGAARSLGADQTTGLGKLTEINPASTPLGNALPFEYGGGIGGDTVMSIAARGVSEAQENDCYEKYNFEMEQCKFARAIWKDPRTTALCKQLAFSNYQSCRGF